MEDGQTKDIQEGKFFAVISYISFLCVVTLLLKKDNKFALYHAKQGLVLFVFEVACFILTIIPFLGALIRILGSVVLFLCSLWGILQALSGNYNRCPVISEIADNIIL
jgi:uncharacterized membrane protein